MPAPTYCNWKPTCKPNQDKHVVVGINTGWNQLIRSFVGQIEAAPARQGGAGGELSPQRGWVWRTGYGHNGFGDVDKHELMEWDADNILVHVARELHKKYKIREGCRIKAVGPTPYVCRSSLT